MSSPTQRTLAKLRAEKWPLIQVVERWNPHARIRQDLFGFIDILAIQGDSVHAYQVTSGSNIMARYAKMATLPSVVHWLDTHTTRRLFIHGWAKRGAKGKRKLWECREVEVIFSDTGNPIVKP